MRRLVFSIPSIVLVIAAVLAALPARAQEHPEDILIVSHRNVEEERISLDDVRAFFLRKRKSWPSGSNAVPVNAPVGSQLRARFASAVLGMSEVAERRYWEEQKVKKGLTPPPELFATLKAVFKLKGSISYIYRKEYKEGVVKILLEIPHDRL